jgi:hypothetical protein
MLSLTSVSPPASFRTNSGTHNASEMVRAGVGLPALMKLLGHVNPEMTMRYVDVVGTDLQREFHLARSQPRHLTPQPKASNISPRGGLDGVVDSLLFAQHAIEMFRRSLPDGAPKHRLDQLANRLRKILAETPEAQPRRVTGRDWPY